MEHRHYGTITGFTCDECGTEMVKRDLFDCDGKMIRKMWVCYKCHAVEEYSHKYAG